ncbi:hypothetical protein H4582DRAFT_1901440 [Lactarius indigo]|nr:hypothetical protein H4582DRAFT_1901440 [Lactarius indigo]
MLAQQSALDNNRIVESQGSSSHLVQVKVFGMYFKFKSELVDALILLVLRVDNVPIIKTRFSTSRFFVTATNHATTKETKCVKADDGQSVHWHQCLGTFSTQGASRIRLRLYERQTSFTGDGSDTLIGTRTIPVPFESQRDVPFVLVNGNGEAKKSMVKIVLYLTITVPLNIASPIFNNRPKIPIKGDNSLTE